MEQLVLVVDCAVEGAGLVVSTGHQAGEGLEAISVREAGQGLPATLSHHTEQVRALCPLRWTEIFPQIRESYQVTVRNHKHLVKFLRLFY